MNCAEVEILILEQMDDPRIAGHVASCESCRAFLAAQTELDQILLGVPRPELSPGFAVSVLAKLDQRPTGRPVGLAWDLAGLGAIAVAVGFAVAYFAPMIVAGAPWIAAGAVMCAGVVTLAEPPDPSASVGRRPRRHPTRAAS
jgi:hypothetical protein